MERGRRGFARASQRKTEKGVMLVPAAFTYLCWAVVSTAAVGYVPEALECSIILLALDLRTVREKPLT